MGEATKIVLRTQEEIALWSQTYAVMSASVLMAMKGVPAERAQLQVMRDLVPRVADDAVYDLRDRLRPE